MNPAIPLQTAEMSAVKAIGLSARQIWARPASKGLSGCRIRRIRPYSSDAPKTQSLLGNDYAVDEWTNVTSAISDKLGRNLHRTENHPIHLIQKLITSHFPTDLYEHHSNLSPIVTTRQNFDSLEFPLDHPGRSKTDTYYVNKNTVLRTHTSAHQLDLFTSSAKPGYTVTADVYRRDAIDRTHYPVFHQMEGARVWDLKKGSARDQIYEEMSKWKPIEMIVEDTKQPYHAENPLQGSHDAKDSEAVGSHMKRSVERVVEDIFLKAKQALIKSGEKVKDEPIRARWIDAYFPFTSPSWELEVYWQGQWLELLGSGVVQQQILNNAGKPDHIGWAFGLGLERLAMLLFNINDIRLFWSKDPRFLDQFSSGDIVRFKEFSKYPVCYKDISFFLPTSSSAAGGQLAGEWHENDFMELVRNIGGDLIEDVSLVDTFKNPKTGKTSLCYRINYRSLERTLTNEETNRLHHLVREKTEADFGVELR